MALIEDPRARALADDLRPHRFTWDQVVEMAALDLWGPTTRVELIGGEIFPMPEEGFVHVDAVRALQDWLTGLAGRHHLNLCIREPVHFAEGSALIPDLSVFPRGTSARDMQVARAELIIEVLDTTQARDRRLKLPRYAAEGVRELWFVLARERVVEVYRDASEGAWRSVARFTPGQSIAPLCAPKSPFDPAALPVPMD